MIFKLVSATETHAPDIVRRAPSELALTAGADGFSCARKGDTEARLQARRRALSATEEVTCRT